MSDGAVYAVLYKSGLFKVGFSASPANRIASHIQTGKSFGDPMEVFFVTDWHAGAKKTESRLLKICSDRFQKNSSEFFEGGDYFSIREVMISSKRLVTWASALKTVGGKNYLLTPVGNIQGRGDIQSEANISDDVSKKITKTLSANPGLTMGVLKNRMRKVDPALVEEVCGTMISQGIVICDESVHPVNKIKIKTMTLKVKTP